MHNSLSIWSAIFIWTWNLRMKYIYKFILPSYINEVWRNPWYHGIMPCVYLGESYVKIGCSFVQIRHNVIWIIVEFANLVFQFITIKSYVYLDNTLLGTLMFLPFFKVKLEERRNEWFTLRSLNNLRGQKILPYTFTHIVQS